MLGQWPLQILAYKHMSALGVCGWVPLLTLPVAQQSQHIVYQYMEEDVPEVRAHRSCLLDFFA